MLNKTLIKELSKDSDMNNWQKSTILVKIF